MPRIAPVDGSVSSLNLTSVQARVTNRAASTSLPVDKVEPIDKVELSPEAIQILEASRTQQQQQTEGVRLQEEVAQEEAKEEMGPSRRLLAALGLIAGG